MRILCLTLLMGLVVQAQVSPDHPGAPVYKKYCEQCHGEQGDGQGVAASFVQPRPRDFTTGVFKFRQSVSGSLPTESDLKRVVVEGIHGTSMPAFAHIGEKPINDVVDYIQGFYTNIIERDKQDGFYPPKIVEIGEPPAVNDGLIEKGKSLFLANGCGDCHGYAGRADGPSALTLKDDYNNPIKAANLTQSHRFRGGDDIRDIYRAFSTGLSGTPMPAYADSLNEADRWALAAYVRSLSPAQQPNASSRVVAAKVDGSLPVTLDDPAWQKTEQAFFPLTAQIIWDPVNVEPTVYGVHVRAMHNGSDLAMLLEWDDPSFSREGDAAAEAPAAEEDDDFWGEEEEPADKEEDFWGDEEEGAGDNAATEPAAVVNDSFAIQLPAGVPKSNERPYFVMGDNSNAVNLWRWTNHKSLNEMPFTGKDNDPWKKYYVEYAGKSTFTNESASGRDKVAALENASALDGVVRYRNGRYSLLIRRQLVSEEGKEVQLAEGQFIPIAFWAWDGHNGEHGAKGSLSSWYLLLLEQPVGASVYYKALSVVVVVFLLQLWAVRAARRSAAAGVDEAPGAEAEHAI